MRYDYFIHLVSSELSPDWKEKNQQTGRVLPDPLPLLGSAFRRGWHGRTVGRICCQSPSAPTEHRAWKWKEMNPEIHGCLTYLHGQRNLQWARVCVCVCVCQRGLLDVAKFYFYLLFGDDLNTLCCQSISRKKPAWLLSAKRIKVIFFPWLFFFLAAPVPWLDSSSGNYILSS